MAEEPKVKRHFFRHHTLRAPEDYIYIAQAINEIGIREFPKSWGLGPAWTKHPFYVSTNKKQTQFIVKYRLGSNNKYMAQIMRTHSTDSYVSASKKLMHAYFKLIVAIRKGVITCFHNSIGHDPIKIPRHSLVWINSRRKICYTGRVFADRGDGVFGPCEVMLDKAKFERWLYPDTQSRSKFLELTPELRKSILDVLIHPSLRFCKEPLWELVSKVLDNRIQYTVFEETIWSNLPNGSRQGRGRAFDDDIKRFKEINPQLEADLRRVIDAHLRPSCSSDLEHGGIPSPKSEN